ncbi:nucleic acid-binding, OB-fold protein [Tanacetum coccineum]
MTAMNVKLYNNKLYLSSGSSSQILDDPQIPALRALRTQTRDGTSHRAGERNAKKGLCGGKAVFGVKHTTTFKCKVKIDGIRTRKGWNFPSCRGEKFKKGVVRREGSFWCQACEKAFEYPMLRYRLELDVSDKTASTVVVMFDEPAIELVKCTTDTLASADRMKRLLAEVVGSTNQATCLMKHQKSSTGALKAMRRYSFPKPTEGKGAKKDCGRPSQGSAMEKKNERYTHGEQSPLLGKR